jgi:iodotyrosine deiodinase
MMDKKPFIKYNPYLVKEEDRLPLSNAFYDMMNKRRSLREFSDEAIDIKIIENIIKTANTAPSGAHKQPWTFCVVQNPDIKKQIRDAAEKEEYENYHGRMSDDWLKDLAAFETDWQKPFLEIAPYLIIVFKKAYDVDADGKQHKNYYVNESVGLACGFLLAAIHNAGLSALTHTPSPMNFLLKVLNRPENERPFLLIPVGKTPREARVPDLQRKPLEEIAVFY